jgi:hypothetical protein
MSVIRRSIEIADEGRCCATIFGGRLLWIEFSDVAAGQMDGNTFNGRLFGGNREGQQSPCALGQAKIAGFDIIVDFVNGGLLFVVGDG